MNEPSPVAPPAEPKNHGEEERTRQVRVAGWTVGVIAVASAMTLNNEPTWPVAFGVTAIAAATAVVCCCILKRG